MAITVNIGIFKATRDGSIFKKHKIGKEGLPHDRLVIIDIEGVNLKDSFCRHTKLSLRFTNYIWVKMPVSLDVIIEKLKQGHHTYELYHIAKAIKQKNGAIYINGTPIDKAAYNPDKIW